MREQAVNQAFEKNSLGVACEALSKSIARWTGEVLPFRGLLV
jgi:hypothetical protein